MNSNKKILVNSLVFVVILFVLLVFVTEEKDNTFTKMIIASNERQVMNVNDDKKSEKIVQMNSDKEEKETIEETNVEDKEVVEVVVPEVVYDGMTMDELADKLNRSLKNELSGKGYLYASYSLEKGVDPYLAVAISLEETGCNWTCSNLVRSCNNVGGMKGSGCGSYGYFNTLDDGIRSFIDNIQRNYVAYGLTTADAMNPKYAENPRWSVNVNNYINRIKNS